MNEYIVSLEKDFSIIENGFKEQEKRALNDFKSYDNEYIKKLAFFAYKSEVYQVRKKAMQMLSRRLMNGWKIAILILEERLQKV